MANVVRKFYRYLSASANRKLDEKADPRVQIDQAITEAQHQHQALVQQAAAVVGNQRQLEMRMARQIDEVERYMASAGHALRLADQSRAAGDATRADRFEQDATVFASQLVSAEASLDDLKKLHSQASSSADQARRAVEDNVARLKSQLAERDRLLTQIEQAAMQEQMSKAMDGMSRLAPPSDTPSLGEVRDKIEKRYAVALGRHELASQGMEARMVEIQRASIDAKASDRLAELRIALVAGSGAGASSAPGKASLEKGPARGDSDDSVQPPP
jgi:phage shock protein A